MLTFAHPSYFWLLLTLAGPVILHLLNRQRLRTLVFPSIRFLRQSQIPQDGRRRLRDILRLLLRLAFLTAVIILLARPKWTPPPQKTEDTNVKTAVFLLDASASMMTGQRLETARQLVNDAMKELDDWQVGGIIHASQIQLQTVPSTDHQPFQKLLSEWSPTFTCGFPDEALKKAVALLGTTGKRRLCIVSDFQLGDWSHKMAHVPQDVETVFLDACEKPAADNAAIADVTCRALAQNRLQVIVSVRNTVQHRRFFFRSSFGGLFLSVDREADDSADRASADCADDCPQSDLADRNAALHVFLQRFVDVELYAVDDLFDHRVFFVVEFRYRLELQ